MVEREKKRQRLVDKYADKREDLKDQFDQATNQMDKMAIHRQLQQLPMAVRGLACVTAAGQLVAPEVTTAISVCLAT